MSIHSPKTNWFLTRLLQAFVVVVCLLNGWAVVFVADLSAADDERLWVYFAGNSIHVYEFDLASGSLTLLSENQQAEPSFLTIHPNGRFLYGCGKNLSAFSIDPASGELSLINKKPYGKHGLCHLVVDRSGKNVLSAGYGSGSVVVRQIEVNGRLGAETALIKHESMDTSKAAHAHSINLDANNHYAFAADLGLDKIVVYEFDADAGTLTPTDSKSVSLQAGAGPRHFSFHPHGKFAYVINELDSTIVAFRYDAGQLEAFQTVTTLPSNFRGENYTAEVVVHPSGRFLYGSNRGHHSIVSYEIDSETGKLTFVEHTPTGGDWPRNFCVDPTGQYLLAANQKSDSVVVFRIDPQSGKLIATPYRINMPNPNCIRFLRPKAL